MLCRNPTLNQGDFFDKTFEEYKDGFAANGISSQKCCIRQCDTVSRVQRVGVFNFGTDRVRVLEKTSGSGSGTDRVRVLALHFYHLGIIGYRKS